MAIDSVPETSILKTVINVLRVFDRLRELALNVGILVVRRTIGRTQGADFKHLR